MHDPYYVATLPDGRKVSASSAELLLAAVKPHAPDGAALKYNGTDAITVRTRSGRKWVDSPPIPVFAWKPRRGSLRLGAWNWEAPGQCVARIGASIVAATQHRSQVDGDRWNVSGGSTHVGLHAAMEAFGRPIVREIVPGLEWEVAPPPPPEPRRESEVAPHLRPLGHGTMEPILRLHGGRYLPAWDGGRDGQVMPIMPALPKPERRRRKP